MDKELRIDHIYEADIDNLKSELYLWMLTTFGLQTDVGFLKVDQVTQLLKQDTN